MELRDYLAVVKRRKWLVLATVATVMAIAGGITASMASTYTATTTLRVATPSSLANAGILGTTEYLDRLQNTYSKLAQSGEVRDTIAKRLRLSSSPQISVQLRPNTELMDLSATARQPSVAAAIANLDVTLLIAQVRQIGEQTLKESDAAFEAQMTVLQRQIATAQAQYDQLLARGVSTRAQQAKLASLKTDIDIKTAAAGQQQSAYQTNRASVLERTNLLSVVTPATPPNQPSGPHLKLALGLGLLVGLIAGLGLAFLFENLSTRMEGIEEIEQASGLPVLGAIPTGSAVGGALFNSGSPTEEAFRRLRTNILAVERVGTAKVLLVTSAEPNEGKSTIVANLSASLAQMGQRVVIVDGDLRLPTLHKIFGIPQGVGFGDVLGGTVQLDDALHSSEVPGLTILPSGGPFEHPAELLASPSTGNVLAALAKRFDVVVVDSPALLALADALSLATEVPDVLVVVSRAQTKREDLVSVHKQLAGIGANPLGVVVNRAEAVPNYYYNRR